MALSRYRRWQRRVMLMIAVLLIGSMNAFVREHIPRNTRDLPEANAPIQHEVPVSDDFTHRIVNAFLELIEHIKSLLDHEE